MYLSVAYVIIIVAYVICVNTFFIFLLRMFTLWCIMMLQADRKGVETMNDRVKELRAALGLSAEKFGARVGVTRSAVSRIENGVVNVTEQMQKSICREFNVNEEWLRNGTGEMFNTLSQDEELAYIVGQALPQADDFVKDTFVALGRLSQEFTPDDWKVVKRFVDALAGRTE